MFAFPAFGLPGHVFQDHQHQNHQNLKRDDVTSGDDFGAMQEAPIRAGG